MSPPTTFADPTASYGFSCANALAETNSNAIESALIACRPSGG